MRNPLSQLSAFRTVLETGSMTEAARVLGKSQPAVSNLISRLETEVGLALFVREKGRLRPTSAALTLSNSAAQVLSGYRRMETSIEMLRSGAGGHLVIAAQAMAGNVLLPKSIARFRQEFPDVTIRVQTMESPKVHEALRTGLFDIGVAATPFDTTSMRIDSYRAPCVVILSANNDLKSESYLSPRLLSGVPFAAVMPDRLHYHAIAQCFDKAGADWNVVCESDSFRVAAEIVSNSDCVAIVDGPTALEFSDSLAIRPFHPTLHYEFALYRGANVELRPVAERFSEIFSAETNSVLTAIRRQAGQYSG